MRAWCHFTRHSDRTPLHYKIANKLYLTWIYRVNYKNKCFTTQNTINASHRSNEHIHFRWSVSISIRLIAMRILEIDYPIFLILQIKLISMPIEFCRFNYREYKIVSEREGVRDREKVIPQTVKLDWNINNNSNSNISIYRCSISMSMFIPQENKDMAFVQEKLRKEKFHKKCQPEENGQRFYSQIYFLNQRILFINASLFQIQWISISFLYTPK